MRYLSEKFKEKQNRLIRPAVELFFEVDTSIMNSLTAEDIIDLDDRVAPIVKPSSCTNEYYYEVLGDGTYVDDPNKICAPSYASETPTHSVPYGVSIFVNANEEVIIGSNTVSENFIGIERTIGISFKGGLIPDYLRVERYESGEWVTEETIDNTDLHEVIYFTPVNTEHALKYRRFVVWNTQKSGRFQLNWVEQFYLNNHNPIIFENNRISSITIDQETDLTSQTLPSYEMTVTCLDVEGIYSPDSVYWKEQFKCGANCYFRISYRDAAVENIPLMFGKLTAEPTYNQNKITFNVAVDWKLSDTFQLASLPDNTLNVGEEVDGRRFIDIISEKNLFDAYNVFHNNSDKNNSKCNYYGTLESKEARQLVANALGCFITVDLNKFLLFNANDIQYKSLDGYLTRYEQITNVYTSRPKVAGLDIIRNEFVLSSNSIDIEADASVDITTVGETVFAKFTVPFYAIGKIVLIDAQATHEGFTIQANVTITNDFFETVANDGKVVVIIGFTSDTIATIKPIVRFYEVNRNEFHETEVVDSGASEDYINDNVLITNSYTAEKTKRVGRFVSDVSNQYEVDVIQNFSRELGDIVRLETDKGKYKTCCITGLKFTFPGSQGHVTCRKIFAVEDSEKALFVDADSKIVSKTSDSGADYFVTPQNVSIAMGKFYDQDTGAYYYSVVGAASIRKDGNGGEVTIKLIKDSNLHNWAGFRLLATDTSCDLPMYDLGTRETGEETESATWGIIKLIMKLYEEQGMVSPLNFENYVIVT